MIVRKSIGEKAFSVFNVIFLLFIVVITIYPFIFSVVASISKPSLLIAHKGLILTPLGLQFDSYRMVFKNPMIVKGYMNTLFIVIMGTGFNILMTSLGAYVLSRKEFLLKRIMMIMVTVTMFFNGGLIPFYFTVKQLHLDDSLWSLIIPVLINTWNLIIMRTSFMGIPVSLEESAKIDGANDFTILFRIIVPLSGSVIAVMILYYSVAHWNAWFNAMIFIRERTKYPLQLILREILINSNTEIMMQDTGGIDREPIAETLKYATIMVVTLPILLVYPFLQKYFVKGVMIGALKG